MKEKIKERVLEAMKEHQVATPIDIASSLTGVLLSQVKEALDILVKEKKIEAVYHGKLNFYRFNS